MAKTRKRVIQKEAWEVSSRWFVDDKLMIALPSGLIFCVVTMAGRDIEREKERIEAEVLPVLRAEGKLKEKNNAKGRKKGSKKGKKKGHGIRKSGS